MITYQRTVINHFILSDALSIKALKDKARLKFCYCYVFLSLLMSTWLCIMSDCQYIHNNNITQCLDFKLTCLNSLLIPTQGFFYVTESANHRNRVFYYRKPVWRRIRQLAVKGTTLLSVISTIIICKFLCRYHQSDAN